MGISPVFFQLLVNEMTSAMSVRVNLFILNSGPGIKPIALSVGSRFGQKTDLLKLL